MSLATFEIVSEILCSLAVGNSLGWAQRRGFKVYEPRAITDEKTYLHAFRQML